MQLTITPLAEAGVAVLPPDIVWNGYVGDFAVSLRPQDGPVGGLVAANPLRTAVLILLFTDARAEAAQLRFEHGGDRRGWPGDGFDMDRAAGEAPLGSTLWLYRRHDLNDDTGRAMAAEAERALHPLIAQKAVARIDVGFVVDKMAGAVRLSIALYGRDGRQSFAERFDYLWRQVDGRL